MFRPKRKNLMKNHANKSWLLLLVSLCLGSAALPTMAQSSPPQINIGKTPDGIVVSWPAPTALTSYVMESCTNITAPVWTANLVAPTIVNGMSTLTNAISGPQFFRLRLENPLALSSFTNLDFSAAGHWNHTQDWPADQVIPGWSASSWIWVDQLLPRQTIVLWSSPPWGEGRYYIGMHLDSLSTPPTSFPSYISQTGLISSEVKSLRFAVSDPSSIVVSLNGQTLAFKTLYTGDHYVKCAADISSFAGTTAELRFSTPGLWASVNGISFSAEPAP
jgi:hypothetical protein